MVEDPQRRDNIDEYSVAGFGDEWSAYDQSRLDGPEYREMFDNYFAIFPFADLPTGAEGFDLGCGSGRWAAEVATQVGRLHCIDASPKALEVARRNLAGLNNVDVHLATTETIPLPDDSQDFGYSLGVLHHIPDTQQALADCVVKLKPGAPFLVYLYYALDGRPAWFRALWRATDRVRAVISSWPFPARRSASSVIAALIYWPLARTAKVMRLLGLRADGVPLNAYANLSFYSMRTDALDRFGTRLEQRFTREQIGKMMRAAGLSDIRFSPRQPYWVACGRRVESHTKRTTSANFAATTLAE